jgi:hypothetical protein
MMDDCTATWHLCHYIDQGECTPQGVERRWHQAFTHALRDMGFTRKQRSFMWDELVAGNWERLHLTPAEKEKTEAEWLDELHWECAYCSDRFSLDRLMRCHWLFRQYMRAATGECWWPGKGV